MHYVRKELIAHAQKLKYKETRGMNTKSPLACFFD